MKIMNKFGLSRYYLFLFTFLFMCCSTIWAADSSKEEITNVEVNTGNMNERVNARCEITVNIDLKSSNASNYRNESNEPQKIYIAAWIDYDEGSGYQKMGATQEWQPVNNSTETTVSETTKDFKFTLAAPANKIWGNQYRIIAIIKYGTNINSNNDFSGRGDRKTSNITAPPSEANVSLGNGDQSYEFIPVWTSYDVNDGQYKSQVDRGFNGSWKSIVNKTTGRVVMMPRVVVNIVQYPDSSAYRALERVAMYIDPTGGENPTQLVCWNTKRVDNLWARRQSGYTSYVDPDTGNTVNDPECRPLSPNPSNVSNSTPVELVFREPDPNNPINPTDPNSGFSFELSENTPSQIVGGVVLDYANAAEATPTLGDNTQWGNQNTFIWHLPPRRVDFDTNLIAENPTEEVKRYIVYPGCDFEAWIDAYLRAGQVTGQIEKVTWTLPYSDKVEVVPANRKVYYYRYKPDGSYENTAYKTVNTNLNDDLYSVGNMVVHSRVKLTIGDDMPTNQYIDGTVTITYKNSDTVSSTLGYNYSLNVLPLPRINFSDNLSVNGSSMFSIIQEDRESTFCLSGYPDTKRARLLTSIGRNKLKQNPPSIINKYDYNEVTEEKGLVGTYSSNLKVEWLFYNQDNYTNSVDSRIITTTIGELDAGVNALVGYTPKYMGRLKVQAFLMYKPVKPNIVSGQCVLEEDTNALYTFSDSGSTYAKALLVEKDLTIGSKDFVLGDNIYFRLDLGKTFKTNSLTDTSKVIYNESKYKTDNYCYEVEEETATFTFNANAFVKYAGRSENDNSSEDQAGKGVLPNSVYYRWKILTPYDEDALQKGYIKVNNENLINSWNKLDYSTSDVNGSEITKAVEPIEVFFITPYGRSNLTNYYKVFVEARYLDYEYASSTVNGMTSQWINNSLLKPYYCKNALNGNLEFDPTNMNLVGINNFRYILGTDYVNKQKTYSTDVIYYDAPDWQISGSSKVTEYKIKTSSGEEKNTSSVQKYLLKDWTVGVRIRVIDNKPAVISVIAVNQGKTGDPLDNPYVDIKISDNNPDFKVNKVKFEYTYIKDESTDTAINLTLPSSNYNKALETTVLPATDTTSDLDNGWAVYGKDQKTYWKRFKFVGDGETIPEPNTNKIEAALLYAKPKAYDDNGNVFSHLSNYWVGDIHLKATAYIDDRKTNTNYSVVTPDAGNKITVADNDGASVFVTLFDPATTTKYIYKVEGGVNDNNGEKHSVSVTAPGKSSVSVEDKNALIKAEILKGDLPELRAGKRYICLVEIADNTQGDMEIEFKTGNDDNCIVTAGTANINLDLSNTKQVTDMSSNNNALKNDYRLYSKTRPYYVEFKKAKEYSKSNDDVNYLTIVARDTNSGIIREIIIPKGKVLPADDFKVRVLENKDVKK